MASRNDKKLDPVLMRKMLEAARVLKSAGETPRSARDILRKYMVDQIENVGSSAASSKSDEPIH